MLYDNASGGRAALLHGLLVVSVALAFSIKIFKVT